MTIQEMKRKSLKSNVPYYFSPDTLKFFGQKLNDFNVEKCKDGRYKASAPSYWDGELMGTSVIFFNPRTNKFESK